MCLNVFIASDRKLPTIAWNPLDPAIYVRPVDELDADLREVFTKRHVYFVGSHEGCGDGFRFGVEPVETKQDEERERKGRRSVGELARYLEQAALKGPVEIYARWSLDPASRDGGPQPFDPSDMQGEAFSFQEDRLLVVAGA